MKHIVEAWYACNRDSNPYSIPMHVHDACEFMFIKEGAAAVVSDNNRFTISANDLVIFPPFVPHSTISHENPYIRHCFHVSCDRQALLALSPELISVLYGNESAQIHLFHLADCADAISIINKIIDENNSDSPFRDKLLNLYLEELLITLYRVDPLAFSIIDEKIVEYRRFLENHFSEKLQISEIAANYFLSTSYFISKFKTYTGFTPHQYRNLCRISHAIKLLTENKLTLSEIADECGFLDANSFIRSFRQAMQTTPAKYREQHPNYH